MRRERAIALATVVARRDTAVSGEQHRAGVMLLAFSGIVVSFRGSQSIPR
jgi:hypothetical protein